jgi:hypothetical protein
MHFNVGIIFKMGKGLIAIFKKALAGIWTHCHICLFEVGWKGRPLKDIKNKFKIGPKINK